MKKLKIKKGYILLPLVVGICIMVFFHRDKGWLTLPQAIVSIVFFTFLLVALIEVLSIIKKMISRLLRREIPPYLQGQKVARKEQKLFPRAEKKEYEFSIRGVK